LELYSEYKTVIQDGARGMVFNTTFNNISA
jgi:hypothetical protein